jgi:tetratricopeptide (TPR) repeat protein
MKEFSRSLAMIAVMSLGVGAARAQPKSDAAANAKAAALYQSALKKSAAGENSKAAELMIEAYNLAPNNAALARIGEESMKAENFEDAVTYYCKYLKNAKPDDPKEKATADVINAQQKLQREVEPDDVCVPKKKNEVKPDPKVPPPNIKAKDIEGTVSHDGNHGEVLRSVGVVAGLIGLGGIGGGVYFTTKVFAAEKASQNPAEKVKADADGKAAERNSQIFYIGGGALVVTGVILYVVGAGRNHDGIQVAPVMSATTTGLAITGCF